MIGDTLPNFKTVVVIISVMFIKQGLAMRGT